MPSIEAQAAEIVASLPVSFRQEAESLRLMGERERWTSGDQACDLIDELYPAYPKAAIHLAVALLYHCTDSTIRDRVYVCRRIPARLRALYPSITFHYWRACAQSGDPIALAEQIIAHKEAYGHLPSVNSVYGWLRNGGGGMPVWVLRMGSLLSTIDKIKNDPLLPDEIAGVIDQVGALIGGVLVHASYTRQEQLSSKHIEGGSVQAFGVLAQDLAGQEHGGQGVRVDIAQPVRSGVA